MWAVPGSRHDRVVALSRVVLPMAIGVLFAFLVFMPLRGSGDVSFLLDKNKVEIARERMRTQAAMYRGADQLGRPFSLSAGSAVQRSSSESVVQLKDLAAQIRLADGPAKLRANEGRYDMSSQQVMLDGPVNFTTEGGYDLQTRDATVDLRTRKLTSGDGATGKVPQGTFSADRMSADLEARIVRLDGNARLRIRPRRAK